MGNKGQISGVLSIVSGVMALLGALCMLFVVAFMATILEMAFEMDSFYPYDAQTFANFMNMFYGTTGIVLAILGIFGIIGGVYAIKRKYWGLGLAAAIVSIITFFPCGIAATILIAMGKSEFDKPNYATSVMTPPPSVQPPLQ